MVDEIGIMAKKISKDNRFFEMVIIVSENFKKNAINSCTVCDIWLKFLPKVCFIMMKFCHQ